HLLSAASVFALPDRASAALSTLSLHDALPIYRQRPSLPGPDPHCLGSRSLHGRLGYLAGGGGGHVRGRPHQGHGDHERQRRRRGDRKSTRLNSSHVSISYAVFCLKNK